MGEGREQMLESREQWKRGVVPDAYSLIPDH
jgi:hypothetical protein